jgi:hypothetical protein
MKAVAINAKTVHAPIELKNCVTIGVASEVTGVRSFTISMKTTRPRRTEMTRETRSPEPAGKRNEMHERRDNKTEGKMIVMM